MPTNIAIKSLPLIYNIPNGTQAEYDGLGEGVKWTGKNIRRKNTFTPSHGDKEEFYHNGVTNSDGSITGILSLGAVQESFYGVGVDKGYKVTQDAGSSYGANVEMYGDGRWMPASAYYGHGFRTLESSDSNNALYLRNYALVFAHRSNSGYRSYGVETGSTKAVKGSGYFKFSPDRSTDVPKINEIRSWGSDWLFQGFIFNYHTGSGVGSVISTLWIHSMKIGWKYSQYPNNTLRAIPNGVRSYGNRNNQNARFTDPYQH
jgi:hypothetical protein